MYFPRKVHVSEEKVAQELENLSIVRECSPRPKDVSKPCFIGEDEQRMKSFQELEDSIQIDEDLDVKKGTVELAPAVINELRKLNRKILIPGSYAYSPKKWSIGICKDLVLWKPPSGAVADIRNIINSLPSVGEEKATGDNEEKSSAEMDIFVDDRDLLSATSCPPETIQGPHFSKFNSFDMKSFEPCQYQVADTNISKRTIQNQVRHATTLKQPTFFTPIGNGHMNSFVGSSEEIEDDLIDLMEF